MSSSAAEVVSTTTGMRPSSSSFLISSSTSRPSRRGGVGGGGGGGGGAALAAVPAGQVEVEQDEVGADRVRVLALAPEIGQRLGAVGDHGQPVAELVLL